jgi:hypothetical protein
MARKKSSAAEKKDVASSPPVLLTQGERRKYTLAMVLAFVVFVIGSLGLLVLLGKPGNVAFIITHFAMP